MKIGKYELRMPFAKTVELVEEDKFRPLTTGLQVEEKITPGRESEDPSEVYLTSQKYSPVEPGFALEWLPVLENFAAYNQDVGYAVDNIVQLSNTPYEIEFADGISETLRKEVVKVINEYKNSWYSFSGSFSSFCSDVLTQAAINGAMSIEIVPNKKLDNIKLVRVPPKYIRFLYNKSIEDYEPFQMVRNASNYDSQYYGYKKLNTVKYKYIAWRRLLEGPYPVPPFLTAIRSLDIQSNIIENLAFIIEKLGTMGFLAVTVEPPKRNSGEKDEEYFKRVLNYLEAHVYPQLKKNLASGIAVGFKGSHEFSIEGNKMNVEGTSAIVNIVEQMLFAGLKQDPNMLGRNFSTTETFGRVILAKMTNQVKEYQTMLNSIRMEIFRLFITLRGYDPKIITGVSCEPAMIRDKSTEETARKTQIENVFAVRDGGIIDQQQAANELGYEKPAEKEAPNKVDPNADQDDKKNGGGDNDDKEKKDETEEEDEETQEQIRVYENQFRKDVQEYFYLVPQGCNQALNFAQDFNDRTMNNFVKTYYGQVYEKYSRFMVKSSNSAVETIQGLNENSPLQTVQEQVYLAILNDWETYFSTQLEDVIESNVDKIYEYYRKDRSIFPGEAGFAKGKVGFEGEIEIPEALFGLDDFRTIEYVGKSDSMYLGKFITDESTKKKVYKYIEEYYINGDLPFGKDEKVIAKFKDQFNKTFDFESYKIRRIIDTSVNNLRNDANIQYINQAELSEYEVIEIGDNLTCEYCNFMNGMTFDVTKAVSKINNKVSSAPENVSTVSPFVTTYKIDEFKAMSPEDLQRAGFSTPSYHANCRGRIVAKV